MSVTNEFIQNLDGSVTNVSAQADAEIKQIADDNTKRKFETSRGTQQYAGDSQMSHRVASIPMIMVEQMMREGIWGNQERMREWLNNPQNEPFRTTKGKL